MLSILKLLKLIFTEFRDVAPRAFKGRLNGVEVARIAITTVLTLLGVGGSAALVDQLLVPIAGLMTPANLAMVVAASHAVAAILSRLGQGHRIA